MKRWISLLTLLLVSGCEPGEKKPAGAKTISDASTTQVFQVKGVVKSIDAPAKSIQIRHEDIPNFMPAMTMPFDVKSTNELAGLHAGDEVIFRLTVTGTDSWVDQIRKLGGAASQSGTNALQRRRELECPQFIPAGAGR